MTSTEENNELKKDLESSIAQLKAEGFDGEIKASVYSISGRLEADVNGDKPGWAASIIKVPIMIATLEEVEKGNLSLFSGLKVDHRFTLETYDPVSLMPQGSSTNVSHLLYHMIVNSDNEATNMLANEIGIEKINKSMWNLGLGRTMLGHLLCPGVERHSSEFNKDGSNITCPNDMVGIMKHIYSDSHSKLGEWVRYASDLILSQTYPMYLNSGSFRNSRVKAKIGVISDPEAGSDVHEVGIIDNDLIVCVMLNKVNQNLFKNPLSVMYPIQSATSFDAFSRIIETISKHYFNGCQNSGLAVSQNSFSKNL